MALPASGQISMNDIRIELGLPSQAPFNIDDARKGAYVPLNPYSPSLPPATGAVSLASWYSYCHTCTPLYAHTVYVADVYEYLSPWSSAAAACSGTRSYPVTVYSSSSVLTSGSTLWRLGFQSYYQFNVYAASGDLWVYDGTGGKPIRMTNNTSNVVNAVDSCAPYYESFTARYDYTTGPICGTGTATVYTGGGWGTGIIVYTDSLLTSPLVGYNYIVNTVDNIIYEINVSTGAIQANTGMSC